MMQINSIFIPDSTTDSSNKTKTNLGLKNFSYLFSNIFNIQKNELENAGTSLPVEEDSPNLTNKTDFLLDVSFLLNQKNDKNSLEVLSILKPFASTEQIESLNSPVNKAQKETVIETLPMSESDFLKGLKNILSKFLKGNSKSKAQLEISFNSNQTNLALKPDKKLSNEIEKLVHSELENKQNFSIVLKKNGTDIYIDVETHSNENVNQNLNSEVDFESAIQSSPQQIVNEDTAVKDGVIKEISINQLNVVPYSINNPIRQPETEHINSLSNVHEKNIISDDPQPNEIQVLKNYMNNLSANVEEEESSLAVDLSKVLSIKNNLPKKNTGLGLNQESLNVISEIGNDNLSKAKSVSYSLPQPKAEGKLLNELNYHQTTPTSNQQKTNEQSNNTQSDSSSIKENISRSNNKAKISTESTTLQDVKLNQIKISNHLSNDVKVKSVSVSDLDQLIKNVNVKEIVIEDSTKQMKNKFSPASIIDKMTIGSDENISYPNKVKTNFITGLKLKSNISPNFILTNENKSNKPQSILLSEIISETEQIKAPIKTVQQEQSINSLPPDSTNTIEISDPDLQKMTAKQNLGNTLIQNEDSSIITKVEESWSKINTENTLHLKTKSLKVDSIRIKGEPELVISKNIIKTESGATELPQNKLINSAVENNSPTITSDESSLSNSNGDLTISRLGKIELNNLDKNSPVYKSSANSKTIIAEQIASAKTEQSEMQTSKKEINVSLNSDSTILPDRNKNDLVTNTINKQEPIVKISKQIITTQDPQIAETVNPVGSKIKPDNTYTFKNEVIINNSVPADVENILTSLPDTESKKVTANQINFYTKDTIDVKAATGQNNNTIKSKLIFPQKNSSDSINASNVSNSTTDNIIELNNTDNTPKEVLIKNIVMNDDTHQKTEIFSQINSAQSDQLISKVETQVYNSNSSNQNEKELTVKQINNFKLTDNITESKFSATNSDKSFSDYSVLNFNHSDNKELKEYGTPPKVSMDLNEFKNNPVLTIENQNSPYEESLTNGEEILSKNFPIKDGEEKISISKEPKVLVKENLPLKLTSSSKVNFENNIEEYSAGASSNSEIHNKPNAKVLENVVSLENINLKIESAIKSPTSLERNIIEKELVDKNVFNKQSLQIDLAKNNLFDDAALNDITDRFDKAIETKDSSNVKNIPVEKSKINPKEKVIGSSSFENYNEEKSIKGRLGINQSIHATELLEDEVKIDKPKNILVEKREINLKEKVVGQSLIENHKEKASMMEQLEVKKSFSDSELSEEKIPNQNFKKQVSQIERQNLPGNIVDVDKQKVVETATEYIKESDNKNLEANKIHLKIKINNQNSPEVIDQKQSSLFENIFSVVDSSTKTITLPKYDNVKSNLNNDQEIKPLETKLKSADSEQKIVTETKSENNSSTQDHSKEDPASYKVLHNQVNDKIENKVEHLSKEPLQHKQVRTSELVKEIYKIIESGETKSVAMKLIPENLGSVKILLDTIDTQVTARVEVDNQTVQKLIQTNVEVLKQSLLQNGVQLNSINVTLSGSEQKQSNLHGNKKRFQQQSNERKIESADEKVSIKNFGYNTYEFLA